MGTPTDDLRELLLGDDRELAFICAEVIATMSIDEPGVDVLECNTVDVAVDRNQRVVTFEGVLSANDAAVSLTFDRFAEVAAPIAEVRSAEQVAEWRERHRRRAWPMPPAAG